MQENKAEQKIESTEEILHDSKGLISNEAAITDEELFQTIALEDEFEIDEEISEALKQQVSEELGVKNEIIKQEVCIKKNKQKRLRNVILLSVVIALFTLLLLSVWLVGTKSGRGVIYNFAGKFIHSRVDNVEEEKTPISSVFLPEEEPEDDVVVKQPPEENEPKVEEPKVVITPRSEDYVMNFLIFGIEEIKHAKNTDAMLLVTINTWDNTIKLTSLLRDTYIEIPGERPTKLNAIYADGGAGKLIDVIENNYLVEIDGFAHVNFEYFEKIIDDLGGISIELGEEEAQYLNTTNYISEPENRKVKPGWNVLNGNQALGYCRVRKCVTLGGANDDYGRTLRQRRVLNAIFQKYKSQNILELISTTNDCLGYVTTNVSAKQIEKCLEAIVENKITSMNTCRIPANGYFDDPSKYNGVDSPLVLDWDKNIIELYQFIFLDTEDEAKEALAEHRRIELD